MLYSEIDPFTEPPQLFLFSNGLLTLFSYSDDWIGERALSLQDLQVLSTIEEISGSLIIETLDRVPSITSLDWLPNLRKVGGAEV